MSKRIRKRLRRTENEYADHSSALALDEVLKSREDSLLFIVDRNGASAGSKRRKQQEEERKLTRGDFLSKTEAKLVAKLQHNVQLKSGDQKGCGRAKQKLSTQCKDLWADEVNKPDSAGLRNNRILRSKRSLVVCAPGLSYNPDAADHQLSVAEAVALEIKARNNDPKMVKPVTLQSSDAGMEIIDQVTNGRDGDNLSGTDVTAADTDSDDESEGRNNVSLESSSKNNRKSQRLTKAQRNKNRSRRIATYAAERNKEQEQILKSIDSDLPFICKDVVKHEMEVEMRRELRSYSKEQRAVEKQEFAKRLNYEEVSTVPLSEELSGVLRTVVPKGVALQLQQITMRKAGEVADPRRRNRRAHEKPHAGKRVVWIPKYKTKDMM